MKNAIVPVSYAEKLGLSVAIGPKGNKLSHSLGKPAQTIDKVFVAKLLKANPHFADLPVSKTGENRLGGKAKSVARFLIDAFKLSENQGYVTMSDLTEVSGLSSVQHGAGVKELSAIISKLCLAGCVAAADKGRAAGGRDFDTETTFAVDDVEIDDVDGLDLESLLS